MPRWLSAGLIWLLGTVNLGLFLALGVPGLIAYFSGKSPSLQELTRKGQLLPGAIGLLVLGLLAVLRKPDNLRRTERLIYGAVGLSLAALAAYSLGVILTLYQFNDPVSPQAVSTGSLVLYSLSIVVSGTCVMRAERR